MWGQRNKLIMTSPNTGGLLPEPCHTTTLGVCVCVCLRGQGGYHLTSPPPPVGGGGKGKGETGEGGGGKRGREGGGGERGKQGGKGRGAGVLVSRGHILSSPVIFTCGYTRQAYYLG